MAGQRRIPGTGLPSPFGTLAGAGFFVAVHVGGVLTVLPPWWDALRRAVYGVGVAAVLLAVLSVVLGRRRPAGGGGITDAPRERAVGLVAVLWLATMGTVVFTGSDVVAAHSLPESTATVQATAVDQACRRRCPAFVTFQYEGRQVRAQFPPDGRRVRTASVGDAFRIDPARPGRAMVEEDYLRGRGAARWWFLGGVLGVVGLPVVGGVVALTRSRRARAVLEREPIVDMGAAVLDGAHRTVTFAGNRQETFVQTPDLEAVLRRRGVQDRPPPPAS